MVRNHNFPEAFLTHSKDIYNDDCVTSIMGIEYCFWRKKAKQTNLVKEMEGGKRTDRPSAEARNTAGTQQIDITQRELRLVQVDTLFQI